ncbi:hypothetical protein NL676_012070 [Syzygium grande]|nr:hypothetical protein NL676_012070 [Syzygium grande]
MARTLGLPQIWARPSGLTGHGTRLGLFLATLHLPHSSPSSGAGGAEIAPISFVRDDLLRPLLHLPHSSPASSAGGAEIAPVSIAREDLLRPLLLSESVLVSCLFFPLGILTRSRRRSNFRIGVMFDLLYVHPLSERNVLTNVIPSPIHGLEDIVNNQVYNVTYLNPAKHKHIPRPHAGVVIPPTVLGPLDIKPFPVLWHEDNSGRRQNGRERPSVPGATVGPMLGEAAHRLVKSTLSCA